MKTSTMTLREAAKKNGINESMLRSVCLRVGGWPEYRDRIAREISEHGADAGWSGFTYYRDTNAFAVSFRREIMAMLANDADDLEQSVPEMVASFGCLAGSVSQDEVAITLGSGRCNADTKAAIWNALAWYALEDVSRRLVEE